MKKSLARFLDAARSKIKEAKRVESASDSKHHVGPSPKNILKKNKDKKTDLFPGQKTVSEMHEMKQLQAESKTGQLKPKDPRKEHLDIPGVPSSKPTGGLGVPKKDTHIMPPEMENKPINPKKIVDWFKKKESLKKNDNLLSMDKKEYTPSEAFSILAKKLEELKKSKQTLPENQSTAKLEGLKVPQPKPAPKQPKLIKGCHKLKKFMEMKKGGKNG